MTGDVCRLIFPTGVNTSACRNLLLTKFNYFEKGIMLNMGIRTSNSKFGSSDAQLYYVQSFVALCHNEYLYTL